MKILVFLLFSLVGFSQNVIVYQINASWNEKNTLKLNLKNCRYIYADLNDISKDLRDEIKSLPAILVVKKGRNRGQWLGGLDMKLEVREEEVQNFIHKLNTENK